MGKLHSYSSSTGGMSCLLPVSSTDGREGWWLLSSVPLRFILQKKLLWGSGVPVSRQPEPDGSVPASPQTCALSPWVPDDLAHPGLPSACAELVGPAWALLLPAAAHGWSGYPSPCPPPGPRLCPHLCSGCPRLCSGCPHRLLTAGPVPVPGRISAGLQGPPCFIVGCKHPLKVSPPCLLCAAAPPRGRAGAVCPGDGDVPGVTLGASPWTGPMKEPLFSCWDSSDEPGASGCWGFVPGPMEGLGRAGQCQVTLG